jgi:hypothetical protein
LASRPPNSSCKFITVRPSSLIRRFVHSPWPAPADRVYEECDPMIRRFSLALAIALTLLGCLPRQSSFAATPGCSVARHCYSDLQSTGTAFYGMYGSWNRAALDAGGPSASNQRAINSEMWLNQSASNNNHWVEVGMKDGFLMDVDGVGHRVFGEWCNVDTNSCFQHSFGAITTDASITDEFQISRGTSPYSWRLYFDGALWSTSTKPGFWSSARQEMGGEVKSPEATSGLFSMHGQGLTLTGARANFQTDAPASSNDTAAGSGLTVLYGERPGPSAWNWKVLK